MNAAKWPSGGPWSVGSLRKSPEKLSADHGLRFHRTEDDLDEVDVAWADDPEIGAILFQRYRRAPEHGTEVLVDSDVCWADAHRALLRRLHADSVEYAWTSPFPTAVAALEDAERQTRSRRQAGAV